MKKCRLPGDRGASFGYIMVLFQAEFDRGKKMMDFSLFIRESEFTDDSVITVGVQEISDKR